MKSSKRTSAYTQAYEYLREQILNGEVEGGLN